jgi:hypothetical protein
MMWHKSSAHLPREVLRQQRGSEIPLRMMFSRQLVVFTVACGLLLGTGCKKKKPQLAVNMQAPTLDVPVPDQIPEITPPPEPPTAKQEATVDEPPPKKTPPKRRSPKKPVAPPANNNQGNTTVATNHPPVNPATETVMDTAIAADVTSQQLIQQKQTTSDLLDSTEKDLRGLSRGLSHDEEIMVAQIKSYVAQSRKASSDGDYERAYNLAMKAHLLADALVKK